MELSREDIKNIFDVDIAFGTTKCMPEIEEIPKELRSLLQKLDENKFTVTSEIKNIEKTHQLIKSSVVNLILGLVLCANMVSTAILWSSKSVSMIGNISVLIILSLLFSIFIIIVLFLRLLKR